MLDPPTTPFSSYKLRLPHHRPAQLEPFTATSVHLFFFLRPHACLPTPPPIPTQRTPPSPSSSPASVDRHSFVWRAKHNRTPAMAMEAAVERIPCAAGGAAPASGCGGAGERRSRFRRICVYCGSAKGRKASYQDAAVELGKELVEMGIDLVYGGGSIGLMGLVSHAVHDGGRHVIGVIPKSLMPREVTGEPVGEVRAVSGMHERKAEMARFADAFIALPGGYGTLEELLEVITWAQLGIHKKPVSCKLHLVLKPCSISCTLVRFMEEVRIIA
ncbi:hypothetical protein GUJ93_ZPchr0008g12368 [Zizania palustris]|uniref:Cytokinin riboside 5'-monophosphate phosphoribohydrolase n=1 Tax=Zizania palustris TaxID=103762 RepID=A0A8J5RE25_ZIZPA|nr:hypothetical protein GUJ93_ZPchr0008g12368 [Zizania palustris]